MTTEAEVTTKHIKTVHLSVGQQQMLAALLKREAAATKDPAIKKLCDILLRALC